MANTDPADQAAAEKGVERDPRYCGTCGADLDGNDPHHPGCPDDKQDHVLLLTARTFKVSVNPMPHTDAETEPLIEAVEEIMDKLEGALMTLVAELSTRFPAVRFTLDNDR